MWPDLWLVFGPSYAALQNAVKSASVQRAPEPHVKLQNTGKNTCPHTEPRTPANAPAHKMDRDQNTCLPVHRNGNACARTEPRTPASGLAPHKALQARAKTPTPQGVSGIAENRSARAERWHYRSCCHVPTSPARIKQECLPAYAQCREPSVCTNPRWWCSRSHLPRARRDGRPTAARNV